MTKTNTAKDGFSVLGLGAAACIACCVGPIFALLGGLGLTGLVSTWLIGGAGLLIAAAAAIGFLLVLRRRQRATCAVAPEGPVPVELRTTSP